MLFIYIFEYLFFIVGIVIAVMFMLAIDDKVSTLEEIENEITLEELEMVKRSWKEG